MNAPARTPNFPVRCAVLFLALVFPGVPQAVGADDTLLGRVDHIADGDSLTITADGDRYRIRLHEIDAPEHDQPGSRASRQALAGKVDGRYVRVTVETVDDYGRTVGKVWLGNRDINREMVREGHAWVYRQYLRDDSLLADEAAARRAKRGLWSRADPMPPWQWRHGGRSAAQARREQPAGECVIKGNISRSGARIYHQPGDANYPQTRINTSAGERWFCSAEEAERAGWRRPR
ncbi:MAG: thermonuclease family protein [Gammaproteobacteria bacterium]|nr:thermonuclease family protein [Gammaproteobacteria bacterium]